MVEEVVMLGNRDAVATIAIKDVEGARKFYEGKLGLKPEPSEERQVLVYKSGNSLIFVYESQYAGTNKATSATWVVDDVHEVAQSLKRNGVEFEHYDFPNIIHEGDVHVSGKNKAAWFRDPDGNILSIVQDTK
jgi:catechol 2,3-dioxygenase-like lactoylglutathione lyase family enzyme